MPPILHTYFLSYLLTYLLIYSMEQSPSCEANRFSASQEFPRIVWKPRVFFLPRLQVPATCPYTEPDQSNPCPHPTSWRSILILSSHLRLGLPGGLFPSPLLPITGQNFPWYFGGYLKIFLLFQNGKYYSTVSRRNFNRVPRNLSTEAELQELKNQNVLCIPKYHQDDEGFLGLQLLLREGGRRSMLFFLFCWCCSPYRFTVWSLVAFRLRNCG